MIIDIFDNMEQASDAEVARLLPLASVQRREEALRFKHLFGQFACLKSYEMLHHILVRQGICTEEDELTFVRQEHGKPMLPDFPKVHFSISHCKNAIAVAVGDSPVGIDVEGYRMPTDGLLRHTMNDDEIALVQHSSHPDEMFAGLWTRKEALYKYLGSGITDDIRQILTQLDASVGIVCHYVAAKRYAYAIASKQLS